MTRFRHIDSPLGTLTLVAEGGQLVRLGFGSFGPRTESDDPVLLETERQLSAYFAGTLQDFDLPLAYDGSDIERGVWQAMLRIPYGKSRTYGEVANELMTAIPAANARIVGTACGANPIAIVIPCHRIMGADGKLTGYSGGDGVRTKAWLLNHEGWRSPSVPAAQLSLFGAAS